MHGTSVVKNSVKILLCIFLLLVLVQVVQAAETYQFVTKWGSSGTGDGQFTNPSGIAIDTSGNVYITDRTHDPIQKFSSDGTFLTKWGSAGTGNGQFSSPEGVAVDSSGNVYVVDTYNSRIQKFSSTGAFITKWGNQGSGDGQFYWPKGVAVDSSGNVYTADDYNHRIQKFSSTGDFLGKWGSKGSGDGQFDDPVGIAVDSSGNVYVADKNNHRIQKFSSTGKFLGKWGSEGLDDGQFEFPYGVAVDTSGNVYVTDENNNRIQKFSSTGKFLGKWGSEGSGDGQLQWPTGIAVDLSGNVYVLDSDNDRIQKFAPAQSTLAVSSITPSTAKNSGAVSITDLSGAGFVAGAKVKFTKTGSEDIMIPSITVISPTKIAFRLDLNGKEGGPWNVVVTNPDGISAMLPSGFTITNAPTPPSDSFDNTPRFMGRDACDTKLQISFSESNNVQPHSPDVYDNRVVFVENGNIYLLDFTAKIIRELTVDGGNSAPAIGNSGVVWVHSYASNTPTSQNSISQIYYYNTNAGETQQITTGDANRSQPAISGNKIVWTDSRNGNQDIYLYDTISRTETQITKNTADQDAPAISDNWVVWRDGRDGPDKTIYLYNIVNGDFSRISSTGHTETGEPAIAGTKVAWAGNRSMLYQYDIPTKSESSLDVDISADRVVSVSRNQLVWYDPHFSNPYRACPPNKMCIVETYCSGCQGSYQGILMYFFADTTQEEVYRRWTPSGGPSLKNTIDVRPKVSDSLLVWNSEKIAVCPLTNQNISAINLRKIPYSGQQQESSPSLKPSQTKMGTTTQKPTTPLPAHLTLAAIGVGIGLYLSITRRKNKI